MGRINIDRIVSKNFGVEKKGKYSNDRTVAEALIKQNNALIDLEREKWDQIDCKEQPLVIISYVPRSGSTLLSQILSSSGNFNYISNFQSRYWMAPYVGGKIEQSLNIRLNRQSDYYSDYGRTRLAHDPSEFNYFWEQWFNYSNDSCHVLDEKSMMQIDLLQLRKQILAIMSLEEKPLFFKKEWLGINAGVILKMFPNARFIHVERKPEDTIKSMLKARREIFGNESQWFGAKTLNYEQLLQLTPTEQITGQIESINETLISYKKQYPSQFLMISHEDILSEPLGVLNQLSGFLDMEIETGNCPKAFIR